MQMDFQYFIQLMRNRQEPAIPKLTTIPLQKCPLLKNHYDQLTVELKILFSHLFCSPPQKQIKLSQILHFQKRPTNMPICNKLFKTDESVYRCYDCSNHEAAVFCLNCFQNGTHKGHRFLKIKSFGGNCDCGNPDAIVPQGFCINHQGKAEIPIINQAEEQQFNRYIEQILNWILTLLSQGLKNESQNLLLHLIIYLSDLNEQSLYYNKLTNDVLFRNSHRFIKHIFQSGVYQNIQTMLAKKATELFLKMFSLEQFKQNLAHSYLLAYNTIEHFESSKFQSLFIQLFANNDLIEKVINTDATSLQPRGRVYDIELYYNSLKFMGTIKQKSAITFFRPIIQKGGVDFPVLRMIQKVCENQHRDISNCYRYARQENSYYDVINTLVRLIKEQPQLLQQELRNQYQLINTYSFNVNNVFLTHQRAFAVQLYAYFKCDLQKIDPEQVADILKISQHELIDLVKKLIRQFMGCLGELATTLAHMGLNQYSFSEYLVYYTQRDNKFLLMDQLGLKIAATLCSKLLIPSQFSNTISAQFASQKIKLQFHNHSYIQIKTKHQIFFLKWVNLLWLLTETICFDRTQIMIANIIAFTHLPIVTEMTRQQLKAIFLNLKEISPQHLQLLRIFMFHTPIDKKILTEIATFDKTKKKFVLNQHIQGEPLKLQFLRSFLMTPETNLKPTGSYEITITLKIQKFRNIFFTETFLQHIYKQLLNSLPLQSNQHRLKSLRDMSTQLKSLHYIFEGNSELLEQIMKHKIIAFLQQQQKADPSLISQIKENLLIDTAAKFNNVDQKQLQKRKLILKQKKQQKLKSIKAKTADLSKNLLNKMTQQHKNNIQNQQEQQDSCIVCHQKGQNSPLCYLAELHMSNIIYSELKVQGTNPFFNCCFHTIHFSCFEQIFGNHERFLCPLCKSIANFALPTEVSIKNLSTQNIATIQAPLQRMELILLAQASKQSIHDFLFQIIKSYIQLFFSSIAEAKPLSDKQQKLFRIIMDIIQIKYQLKSQQQRFILHEQASLLCEKYKKTQQIVQFDLGQFIELVFSVVLCQLKQELGITNILAVVQKCNRLNKEDVIWFFKIANQLFERSYSIEAELLNIDFDSTVKPLSSLIDFYQPPKTIKQLLQNRRKETDICKPGHDICICVICKWQGCFDCKQAAQHSLDYHNTDTLFFSLLTAGFTYNYKGLYSFIHSFYFNDTGQIWMPKYGQEDFFFDQENYKKILEALKAGKLMNYIKQNQQTLKAMDRSHIF